jgi:hypothetical protein
MPTEVEELTDVDGLERSDAELIFAGPPEDWREEANAVQADLVGKMALDDLIASKVAEQVAKILAAMNPEPVPKAMISKVHDRFVGSNAGPGTGNTIIKHFRCESAHSVKLAELDMDLLQEYEEGDRDRPTNEKGRLLSIIDAAIMPGKWIDWIEGHCYCYTTNQVRNVERVKRLAEQGLPGGMPGIYEDTGVTSENWQCFVCQHQPKFANKETFDNHMLAVHDVAADRAA